MFAAIVTPRRYRIHYIDAANAGSVLHVAFATAMTLDGAGQQARDGQNVMREEGATGFQLRDMEHAGRLAFQETFAIPNEGYAAPFANFSVIVLKPI